MHNKLDNIRNELLVEILSRLPLKTVFRCRCVSKTWCTLVSHPDFIGRYLSLHSVNIRGDELLDTNVFAKFRNLFRSKLSTKHCRVLAACNDLVLYLTMDDLYQYYDYHIFNRRTMQVLTLPRPPPLLGKVISEIDDDGDQGTYEIKVEYRCKVVGVLTSRYFGIDCFNFNMLVFSSETGEWGESVVSCPEGYVFEEFWSFVGVANNRMIYWISRNRILVFDLHRHRFHVIQHSYTHHYSLQCCFGTHQGSQRLRFYLLDVGKLCIWDIKEEELEQTALWTVKRSAS